MTGAEAEHHRLSDPGKEGRRELGIPVVPVFDGYRAIAILGIVLLHVIGASIAPGPGTLGATIMQGTLGQFVEVLFVISGFVVYLPTVAREGDFGSVLSYAIRRAARLIPAYWLALSICLVLIWLFPLSPMTQLPGISEIATNFAGAQVLRSFFVDFPMGFGLDGPVWTLSLEVTFYLILPFIAAVYFRRPWAGLLIALAITALWKSGLNEITWINGQLGLGISPEQQFRMVVSGASQFPSWAFSFALGMTGAWAYVKILRRELRLPRSARFIQPVSFIALVFFAYLLGYKASQYAGPTAASLARESVLISVGYSASLACVMVSTAFGPAWTQWPFANEAVRKLGDISYGIYLIHVPLLYYAIFKLDLLQYQRMVTFLILSAIVFPVSFLYGYLSARFLEQPIRRWARRFGQRSAVGEVR